MEGQNDKKLYALHSLSQRLCASAREFFPSAMNPEA